MPAAILNLPDNRLHLPEVTLLAVSLGIVLLATTWTIVLAKDAPDSLSLAALAIGGLLTGLLLAKAGPGQRGPAKVAPMPAPAPKMRPRGRQGPCPRLTSCTSRLPARSVKPSGCRHRCQSSLW